MKLFSWSLQQRVLFIQPNEGLIIVPLIGASAFRSFKSPVKDAPLPEGVNLKEIFSTPSRFGLNVKSK